MYRDVDVNIKHIKYVALVILLVFPLSCAKKVPRVKRKKADRVIIKKPTKKETIPQEKKEVKKIKPDKKVVPKFPILLPTYFNEKDGSDMALVPGGFFIMGDNQGEKNERPAIKVNVPDFYIDIYEITNEQYGLYNDNFENDDVFDCNLCPITGITWKEAENYCKWAGKRLPTEAEWEKTARGSQQLKWSWGNSPKKNAANILNNQEPQSQKENNAGPVKVGSFPQGASVFGVFDMTGNVWEWTDSPYTPYENNLDTDIRYQEDYRVLRGGSWKNILENARTSYRHPVSPDTKLPNIGFRCVKDVENLTTYSQ